MFLIHDPLTVLALTVVLCGGFGAGATAGMVYEYFMIRPAFPAAELPLMLAMFGLPNLAAILLSMKVWRSPDDWTLLGHRKRVWQVLVVASYAMGICGSIATML